MAQTLPQLEMKQKSLMNLGSEAEEQRGYIPLVKAYHVAKLDSGGLGNRIPLSLGTASHMATFWVVNNWELF